MSRAYIGNRDGEGASNPPPDLGSLNISRGWYNKGCLWIYSSVKKGCFISLHYAVAITRYQAGIVVHNNLFPIAVAHIPGINGV
jgi:hypothetical protein